MTQTTRPADLTQPSPRLRPRWPWWSIVSLVILAVIVLACAGVMIAYATRPAQEAALPTAILMTVTPKPGPTYIVVTSQVPTVQPGTSPTRFVRVAGTQGLQLRIRSAPGSQSETIKLVPDGTRLIVTGEGRQVEGALWWPVRDPSDNAEGWAVSTYLVPDAGP